MIYFTNLLKPGMTKGNQYLTSTIIQLFIITQINNK